jgi:hypothetical protein
MPGPSDSHGEAGDPALEDVVAAVHGDALPNAQAAQLRFLEVGVNSYFVGRTDRHRVLADVDILARIDVAPRDNTAELRSDIAVTESQFGLRKIAPGAFKFRLGLLDGRGIGRESGERAVDVVRFLELVEHRFRTRAERVHNGELSGTLNKPGLRLEDG